MKIILKKIDSIKTKIDTHRPMDSHMVRQLQEYFRIDMIYSSNALEGNSLTQTETKIVIEDGITIGGVNSENKGAHLRYFIISDELRGTGVGRELITRAVAFCREAAHRKVYRWTFEGLHAARHLYEGAGFRLVEMQRGSRWGAEVTEQRFELHLP